ncbi:MAG TPA: recombination mediator RecR [Candidatus Saccharibacteria bacterium]|nr:recombination mediator RecR [Candidatus Saccharibacteria bacterium]
MQILPPALEKLIEALGGLPGVGPRTAERYAYFLLKNDRQLASRIASTAATLHDDIDYCKKTFALVQKGQEYSELYTDPRRDKTLVAVVAEPFDIVALEKTSQYHGTYHVLGGVLSPIDGVTPEQLHVRELLARIEEDAVKEVILATNASVEGESTALYLQQQLQKTGVVVSRLARGLSVGVDLEYADQLTLGRALEGRQVVN